MQPARIASGEGKTAQRFVFRQHVSQRRAITATAHDLACSILKYGFLRRIANLSGKAFDQLIIGADMLGHLTDNIERPVFSEICQFRIWRFDLTFVFFAQNKFARLNRVQSVSLWPNLFCIFGPWQAFDHRL